MDTSSTFYQHVIVPFDHPVTSLSISPVGRQAVLAAKQGLFLVDLESPFSQPVMLGHSSKWEVFDIEWYLTWINKGTLTPLGRLGSLPPLTRRLSCGTLKELEGNMSSLF
jgi:hypothetical protein